MYKIKLTFLIILLQVTSNFAFSQKLSKQYHNVNIQLGVLMRDKELKNAGFAFYAKDIDKDVVIAEHNSDLALMPASTQKVITTATAMETLGAYYRFETKLLYTGKIDTSTKTLNGNIIIQGGGDPTLGSKYYKSYTEQAEFLKKWTDTLKKAGIEKINGNLIADARYFSYDILPTTWSWEDMGNYFGAGACGLSVFDNFYSLEMKTSPAVGKQTEIVDFYPKINEMTFNNTVESANVYDDQSYIYGAPYTYHREIRGKLPKGKDNYEIRGSTPDPAFLLVKVFEKELKENNITVSGKTTTYRLCPDLLYIDTLKAETLYITKSPYLHDIIRKTNFISFNLYAEHMLNAMGKLKYGLGDTKRGSDYVEWYWKSKGMDSGGMSINDGSGLSRYNTFTAKQMVFVLEYMKEKSKYKQLFAEALPVVGKTGTVSGMCRGTSAANNMQAKSGSIRNVRAYAGYVKSKSGRNIAFSVIMNNFNCSSSKARKKIEKLLVALADFNK